MQVDPCKNCEKKGCGSYHDICDKYQSAKKNHIEQIRAKKKAKAIQDSLYKVHINRYGRGWIEGQR